MQNTITNGLDSRLGRLMTNSPVVELCLDTNNVFRLERGAQGATILALSGRLWVTRSGDDRDYLLEAGERYVVRNKGMVLVQGSPEGKARIIPGRQ
jgi:hypothetical protein